jgi:DNA-binding MarR family transcriptional regulator
MMRMPTVVDAVVFDCDGLLAETESAWTRAETTVSVALSAADGSFLVELHAAGAVTQQLMADRPSIDKSRVSRLCAALERMNLLARERDASDRRSLRLCLTESGETAATRLRRAYHERTLGAMTPGERQAPACRSHGVSAELAAVHANRPVI